MATHKTITGALCDHCYKFGVQREDTIIGGKKVKKGECYWCGKMQPKKKD